jgi:hypothetical protein
MGKWVGILIVAMIALAVIGFLVDTLRFFAGAAVVVILVVLAFRFFTGRKT